MSTVYVVRAEHYKYSGVYEGAFASRASAEAKACKSINVILADARKDATLKVYEPIPDDATPDTWAECADWLNSELGMDGCEVTISEYDVAP